jgi:hypothetical protein
MIKTHLMVMEELKEYASPKARLTRMLKSGGLIQVRRGLFVDDPATSRKALAPVIYGPSYISFQYVLAACGLIPERVTVITSATFNKNKDKVFQTALGEYRYMYMPGAVYPYGITQEVEDGMSYLIATPEKALCDAVYKNPGVTSTDDMDTLLREDWRMDMDLLATLDAGFISWIAPLYRRKSVATLAAWFQREVQR